MAFIEPPPQSLFDPGAASDAGDKASIYAQRSSSNVGSAGAGQENNRAGVFFRLAVTANRNGTGTFSRHRLHRPAFALGLGLIQEADSTGRVDAARDHGVDCNPVARHFA